MYMLQISMKSSNLKQTPEIIQLVPNVSISNELYSLVLM